MSKPKSIYLTEKDHKEWARSNARTMVSLMDDEECGEWAKLNVRVVLGLDQAARDEERNG